MVRKSAATRLKQQGEVSTFTPKAAFIEKNATKDDHLAKKVMGPSARADKEAWQPKSPPPPHCEACKGLMTAQGPVIAGSVQRLVSHMDYVVEMVNLIIKEANLD